MAARPTSYPPNIPHKSPERLIHRHSSNSVSEPLSLPAQIAALRQSYRDYDLEEYKGDIVEHGGLLHDGREDYTIWDLLSADMDAKPSQRATVNCRALSVDVASDLSSSPMSPASSSMSHDTTVSSPSSSSGWVWESAAIGAKSSSATYHRDHFSSPNLKSSGQVHRLEEEIILTTSNTDSSASPPDFHSIMEEDAESAIDPFRDTSDASDVDPFASSENGFSTITPPPLRIRKKAGRILPKCSQSFAQIERVDFAFPTSDNEGDVPPAKRVGCRPSRPDGEERWSDAVVQQHRQGYPGRGSRLVIPTESEIHPALRSGAAKSPDAANAPSGLRRTREDAMKRIKSVRDLACRPAGKGTAHKRHASMPEKPVVKKPSSFFEDLKSRGRAFLKLDSETAKAPARRGNVLRRKGNRGVEVVEGGRCAPGRGNLHGVFSGVKEKRVVSSF